MTLNTVIALILRFLAKFDRFSGRFSVTVVEDRLIMSVKYCLPVSVFHFLAKAITHPAVTVIDYLRLIIFLNVIVPWPVMCCFMLMPMLLCDCQSFIKESYLLTYSNSNSSYFYTVSQKEHPRCF